jgi:nickel/cobalt transporter (NicO) family protein
MGRLGQNAAAKRSSRHSTARRWAAILGVAAVLLVPAVASAHPLGNFTINHYAGLVVGRDAVQLEVVIDMAEIPAFQERQAMDADLDGTVSDAEGSAWAGPACAKLAESLRLTRAGTALGLGSTARAVSFPPGAGGLSTLRLECGFSARLTPTMDGRTAITFEDRSYGERIGWREIVATGDGTVVDTHGLPATSPSAKLTSYPADLIAQPLDIRSATIDARSSGAASSPTAGPAATAPAAATVANAAVPGGVGNELPDIFRAADLTPFVLLLSLLTAVGLGAAHAVTPGHGKTLMAAYLVGSRGTATHAIGLGLSVALSHTLGIVVLALVIVGAQGVLPPDVVVRLTPVIAAVSIVAVGGWMLAGQIRSRRRVPEAGNRHEHAQEHAHAGGASHHHGPDRADDVAAEHGHAHGHMHEHEDRLPPTADGHADGAVEDPLAHSHGGARHTHLPAAEGRLSWRGLFVLGLAGGLIPSTSALLILLGSLAAGRAAFGLILVVAFGLGMAGVMSAVGLAMVVARSRLDRLPAASRLGLLASGAPLVASIAVLGLGLVLTWSAVAGRPVL